MGPSVVEGALSHAEGSNRTERTSAFKIHVLTTTARHQTLILQIDFAVYIFGHSRSKSLHLPADLLHTCLSGTKAFQSLRIRQPLHPSGPLRQLAPSPEPGGSL